MGRERKEKTRWRCGERRIWAEMDGKWNVLRETAEERRTKKNEEGQGGKGLNSGFGGE